KRNKLVRGHRLVSERWPRSVNHAKNLQTKEAKKIWISRNGPPAFVRMLIQYGQAYLLHCALVGSRRPCVIDHPVVRAFAGNPRFTEKNHDVKGILMDPRLMKKEQIAGPCLLSITADETCIEHLESLTVCKL